MLKQEMIGSGRCFLKNTKEILEVAPIMHELRSIKSETEISLLQNACNITEKGVRRILPFIKLVSWNMKLAELIRNF